MQNKSCPGAGRLLRVAASSNSSFEKIEIRTSQIGKRIFNLTQGDPVGFFDETLASDRGRNLFLVCNSKDKTFISAISKKLRLKGVITSADDDGLSPGHLFQGFVEKVSSGSKAISVFIGSVGLGKWQVFELREAISIGMEKGIPVVPVLLPEISEIPIELAFLKAFNYVRFTSNEDEDAFNKLILSISPVREFFSSRKI